MTETEEKRITAKERRHLILERLQSSTDPITGSELAEQMNVSRQVIVQDISLIKAKEYPIIATSQGYLFIGRSRSDLKTRTVACRHSVQETENELTLVVSCGVTIINVTVEHPLYGEITGSLMIRNHADIAHFISRLETTGASLLSSLTGGIHLHQFEAPTDRQIDDAVRALKKAGYLL
ncbi:transcription repressor NadR [Sporolactobacillus shoreae]|uniref:Transcription repressor NadR n=1 Tax=Sporolactobacillus shoreae TaxID=1465501 RepID=A0A4Z0GSJ2_9BACL|nr:transcription repressor NadR [Sporolactobacillus shoreae]TGA99497.1 transcription repressor NadR [Sporolactobacillus shoreae]